MLETEYNKTKQEEKTLEEKMEIAYKTIEQEVIRRITNNCWNYLTPKQKEKEIRKNGKGKYGTKTIDVMIVWEINSKFSKKKQELEMEFEKKSEIAKSVSSNITKTNLTIDSKIPSPNPVVENEKQNSVVELKLRILQLKREEFEILMLKK